MTKIMQQSGKFLILTITFDQGGEFTFHQILKTKNIVTYFCDAGCPKQKGLVENKIGKICYTLSKEFNFGELTQPIITSSVCVLRPVVLIETISGHAPVCICNH